MTRWPNTYIIYTTGRDCSESISTDRSILYPFAPRRFKTKNNKMEKLDSIVETQLSLLDDADDLASGMSRESILYDILRICMGQM